MVTALSSEALKTTDNNKYKTDIYITRKNQDENNELAEQLANHRESITQWLAALPLTALYYLTYHGQPNDKEDRDNGHEDSGQKLRDLRRRFLAYYKSAYADGSNCLRMAFHAQQLKALQANLPLVGEDIIALCALVVRLSGGMRPAQAPTIFKTTAEQGRLDQRIEKSIERYEMRLPGFLCPESIVTANSLNELFEHYRQWSHIRQQFVSRNQGLVRLLQRQYQGNALNDEDLIQEAQIGLLKAIDRFDYRLGFKFSTYSAYWIRQSMSRALSRSERTVRLPLAQLAAINKLCQARERLLSKTGHKPSDRNLADELRWPLAEVSRLQNVSQLTASLDESFSDDKDNNLLQLLPQEGNDSPMQLHSERQLHQLLTQGLSVLNNKEQMIICWRFGFSCGGELTLEEIGERLDLTRERVRQIQVLAMAKIKSHYGAQLRNFLA